MGQITASTRSNGRWTTLSGQTAKIGQLDFIGNQLRLLVRVVLCTSKGGDAKVPGGWVEVSLDDSGNSKNAEQDRAEKSRIQNLLSSYNHELSRKMIPGRSVVLQGDARQALVGKATELRADILIMGSRGMGALKKFVQLSCFRS